MAEATNKMLQFKMGLHTNLPTTKQAGTVYVTTDEQAMYVDINDNDRIRLSDIIQVETVNKLRDMAPKYSSTALYYVIDENALLKYTGNGTTHSWKQVNSVSDVQASVTELANTVTEHGTAIASLNETVNGTENSDGLVKRVTTLEGEMDDAEKRLTATEGVANSATTAIGQTSEDAEGTGSLYARIASTRVSIGEVNDDLQTLSNNFGTLNSTVTDTTNGLVKQVTDLRTDLGNKTDGEEADSAFGKIAKLREDLDALDGEVDTLSGNHNTLKDRVDTINTTLGEAQSAISGNAEDIKALQDAIGDGTGTESLTSRLNTVETWKEQVSGVVGDANGGLVKDVADLKGNVGTLQAKDTELAGDIQENTTAIEGVADRVSDLEDVVGDADGGLVKDVADLQTADTQINGKIDGLTTRMTTAEGTIKEHTTSITELQADVQANTQSIAKLNGLETEEGSVAYQVKQAKDALSAEIDADINAANAMTYKGGVDSYSALPTSDVRIGDTYVLTDKNGQYNPGDFFIASAEENSEENGVITGTVTWSHVKTGYDAKLESKLTGANGKLLLTSHTGEEDGDLGKITFTAQGSATVAVADNQVTIGMAWGEF